METPDAMTGRIARPQRPLHFQTRRSLAFLQGVPETARLTRQVVEGGFQGFEPAQEDCAVFPAIVPNVFRRRAEVDRTDFARAEKGDARLRAGPLLLADDRQARIEKPEAGAGLRLPGPENVSRHGPERRGFRWDGEG